MSQITIAPSLEPEANREPLFENLQYQTSSRCSANICVVSLGKSSLRVNK